jgi:zinc/manganese transport system substrate-binding protein
MIRKLLFSLVFLATPLQAKPLVVVSFSILADIVRTLGQDLIDVQAVVGANQDTHVYEPTPATSQLILQADLVIINGLGFEKWFENLIQASGYQDKIIVASDGIKPLTLGSTTIPVFDPHVWNDVANVKMWVHTILVALQTLLPQHKQILSHNAAKYLKELSDLEAWIHQQFKGVPPENRKVITAHDAFHYFECAYHIAMLSPQGLSTEEEPSAFVIARLIKQIRAENISSLFVENMMSPRVIQQIAAETGIKIGGTLYSDALSSTPEADTYLKLMRHNVTLLTAVLKKK